jgi:transcriptional regulator GlxA family with amidase domain
MCRHPSQQALDTTDTEATGPTPRQTVIPQRSRQLARLRRVRDRIDREYAQPLDVEALARGEHMAGGDLSRAFRCAYGQSPYGYLMRWRIERAIDLLRCGGLSVTDVCVAVGCSSVGTFSTRFTELVGMPPGVYRRRQATGATAGTTPHVGEPHVATSDAETGQESRSGGRGTAPSVTAVDITIPQTYRQELS